MEGLVKVRRSTDLPLAILCLGRKQLQLMNYEVSLGDPILMDRRQDRVLTIGRELVVSTSFIPGAVADYKGLLKSVGGRRRLVVIRRSINLARLGQCYSVVYTSIW